MLGAVPSALLAPVVTIGQTFTLMFAVIKTAVQNPVGYWRDTFEEMYSMYRFCWLPTFVCAGTFGFLIGNFAYNFLRLAGGGNRLGTFFTYAMAREIAPFTTGMAVAGVMGTAMCADLGARKVREELDALRVLGVDIVRTLVLPRVISIIMMCTAFNLLTIGIGTLMALISASVVGDTSPGAFFGLLLANFTAPEMAGSVIKMAVIGLFIGVVCAQKGLNAGGGAEGVGRAVNQAVVLCFAATWIFDFLGNMVLLGMFPEVLINR
ncbi:MlaE family ABC transporter permease [Pseudonocardia pini]|uniref:MlaE family ABC transporter permease n=1 Tax=Pseudonocardia pini TaxID=2758030 RepID=UPI001C687490|nr:ABC transporter permease [Pseudonocardia pini]